MAQILNLPAMQALSSGAASAPAPVSTATPNPVAAAPVLPGFNINTAAPPAPAPDPNASPFSNFLGGALSLHGSKTPGEVASAQTQADAVAQQPTGMEYLRNFFGGNQASTDQLAARQNAGNVLSHPVAANIVANDPTIAAAIKQDPVGMAAKLQPIIEAATNAPPSTVYHPGPNGTVTKQVPDPAHLAAVAQIAGGSHADTNPWVNHGDYTDDEFINATQHLNWKQAARMFGAAQRLSPTDQITNQYAGILHDNAAQAKAAYDAAVQNNEPKVKTDELAKLRDKAAGDAAAFLKKKAEGSQVMFPDSAVQ